MYVCMSECTWVCMYVCMYKCILQAFGPCRRRPWRRGSELRAAAAAVVASVGSVVVVVVVVVVVFVVAVVVVVVEVSSGCGNGSGNLKPARLWHWGWSLCRIERSTDRSLDKLINDWQYYY